MKKFLFICAVLMFTGLTFNSCSPDDAVTQGQVRNALLSRYPGVSCSVRNSIVALSGTVDSEEARVGAEEVAKGVKNVKSVVNEIEVIEPVAAVSPDESLKTAISVALGDAGFKDVWVEVKDEEVTLSGKVSKADQKKVLDVVKGIKTKKVINDMK